MGIYNSKYSYKGKYKNIIGDWGQRDYCTPLETRIDEWLLQFHDTEKSLMLKLLKQFKNYREKQLANECETLFNNFYQIYPDYQDNARFFKIIKKDEVPHSEYFYGKFYQVTNLHRYCMNGKISNIDKTVLDKISRIIIMDDFIGSGDSLLTYLREQLELVSDLKNKEIIILTIEITELAENAIKSFGNEKNLDIIIINNQKSKKAFSNRKVCASAFENECRKEYLIICERLNIPKKYYLGYKNTEALIAFYDRAANNTLGLFWCENAKSLFHRNDKPIAPNISELNKNTKEKLDLVDFANYIILKKRRLNKIDTCRKFGLTATQYDNWIKLCFDKGWIKQSDGKYVSTDVLNKITEKHQQKVASESKIDYNIKGYLLKDFDKRFNGYK